MTNCSLSSLESGGEDGIDGILGSVKCGTIIDTRWYIGPSGTVGVVTVASL
eukprot:CAMPEP_0201951844 /NCGR_PEP_ID=MMETSP0904-20121228/748_1 /ASSEMBLY_ACC=CAM_ASM_000553 /TAXON_ID=420261 /ORGANISM="Thalassiosira antarctica, Strain CCMP982" /LENGTH=50 /DNA_ID=CAMNT_0048495377 /DNA_START=53 /DNA_END=201 /DNA_ORIENTATION=-